ncbi:MAG: hypothetical protein ACXVJE_14185 [Mucilaginibacter sp.]
MKRVLCVIALLSLLFTSCHPLFCVWNLGYERVLKSNRPASLTGFYVLDKHSLDQMKYEGSYKITHHSLELFSNGTYRFSNLPDWVLNPYGDSKKSVIDNQGKLEVQCDQNGCNIIFDGFKDHLYGDLRTKNNKIAILFNVGDPDGCVGLVYLKAK